MADDLPGDFVARPAELEEAITNLLKGDRAKPVGITALYGGGGFGKTTLARAICHDVRVQDTFDDGILWVTLGETPGDPTAQLEELIYVLSGQRPGYTSMDAALTRFRELLESRDILIVIDDVWQASHLRPFLQGGDRCARLITTRNSDTLPSGSLNLKLESMTSHEAVKLLTAGLDSETPRALDGEFGKLAGRLGEWPLLLTLVNGNLRKRVNGYKQPVIEALSDVNQALTRRGLTAFDRKDPHERNDAVAKTIGLSIALLDGDEKERYQDLAVFPEDLDVTLVAVGKLWSATGGLDAFECKELCERLADLSLLLKFDLTGATIGLHDVFRQYLIDLQGDRLPVLHAALLDAWRPAGNGDAPGSEKQGWADLPLREPYIWDHLAYHLIGAGRTQELASTVKDLRYVAAKVRARGALALEQDLMHAAYLDSQDAQLAALRRAFIQCGHLFGRLDNVDDIASTLCSRIAHIEILRPMVERLDTGIRRPWIAPCHPLPDLPHPALVRTLTGHSYQVTGCGISWDGKRAVLADDQAVKVWDLESGAELFTLTGHSSAVGCCGISGDGKRAVSASDDKTMKVWDLENGLELFTLTGHSSDVNGCAISADGKRALTSSSDKTLKLWDLENGCALMALVGHSAAVNDCAMNWNGDRAVSASDDGTLRVWDLEDGHELRTLVGHSAGVIGCALSSDGKRALSASFDESVKLWDLQNGQSLFSFLGHSAGVTGCAISGDGKRGLSSSDDEAVKFWDLEAGRELLTLRGHSSWADGYAVRCAISEDGRWGLSTSTNETVNVWDLGGGGWNTPTHGDSERINGCAVGTNGELALSASDDRTLKLWDVQTFRELLTLRGHSSWVNACSMSKDGKRALSASADDTLRVWDLSVGKELHTLNGHSGGVNGCAISDDGMLALSASTDRTLKLWDLAKGRELLTLSGHFSWVNGCSLSGDGKRALSVAADETVRMWDLEDGRETSIFTTHSDWVNCCATTPDWKRAVTASNDRTVRVWDLEGGCEILILTGHSDWVTGCGISGDGKRAISTSNDQTVRVWDLENGACLSTLAMDGTLAGCAISRDGTQIVLAGARGVYFLRLVV